MKKQLIEVGPDAIDKINNLIQEKQDKPMGIRVTLKTRGCSGLSWNLDFVYEESKFDEIVDCGNFKLFVDPKAVLFVLGSKIEYNKTELEEGFEFVNPNEKSKCGCGESFKI